MDVPAIDIDALPLLDTHVGLFGSFAGDCNAANASVFEVGVTVIMIIHDFAQSHQPKRSRCTPFSQKHQPRS